MPRFTKIPTDTFKQLVVNAGVLLDEFAPSTGTFEDENIIGATSGGTNITCVPTYSDYGDDIDNCPKNTKELKKIETWEVKVSGSLVTMTTAAGKRLLAAADIGTTDNTKVTPRLDLLDSDFADLWLVCDYSDKTGATKGGCIAVHILNALSTGGFSLQTTDKGKGKFSFEFTGHVSIENQDVVPFELYIKAGTAEE